MTTSLARGDELIERILAEGDDGQMSNDLLREMFRGYPIENLLPLLRSEDDEVVKVGAFVAEELGKEARPLLQELVRLLKHENRRVRYDALTAVFLAAKSSDGEARARAVELIDDPDPFVQKNALELLACVDKAGLAAACKNITDSKVAATVDWLLKVEESLAADAEIDSKLADKEKMARMLAGVAAARRYQRNPGPLDNAAASADGELKALAEALQRRVQRRSPR